MIINEEVKLSGDVQGIIEYKTGEKITIRFKNTILKNGRTALASTLANKTGDAFQFYVQRMIFGDGGTADGSTKYVSSSRNGLFGVTRSSRPVFSTIDPNISTQVTFTSILPFTDDSNGYNLNEMALKLANSDLYSMVTFPGITKTSGMQITFHWKLSFI